MEKVMKLHTILFVFSALFFMILAQTAFAEGDAWYDKIQLNGMIDARIVALDEFDPIEEGFETNQISDVYLYGVTLGVEVDPFEYATGVVSFRYDQVPPNALTREARTDYFYLEEGYLNLHLFWLYFQAGMFYQKFYQQRTMGVVDSLPYILGETWHPGFEAGLDSEYVTLAFSGFNGDLDITGESDTIDDWVLSLDVKPLAFLPDYDLNVGCAYLWDGSETTLEWDELLHNDYKKKFGSWTAHLAADLNFSEKAGLWLYGDFVSTTAIHQNNYRNTLGQKTNISAMGSELAIKFMKNFWIGGRYDRIFGMDWLNAEQFELDTSDNYQATYYHRYGGYFGVGDREKLHAEIEYLHGNDNELSATQEVTLQFRAMF